MKKLLYISFLFAITAQAQTEQYIGTPNNWLRVRGGLKVVNMTWNGNPSALMSTYDTLTKKFGTMPIPSGGGSGESNTASNLGGGLANYSTKVGVDLRFNSFEPTDFDLASNLISIDAALKSNWNTAYSWGNHATAGYGINNANIGIGYRLLKPASQDIKTLFAGTNITIDSTSNADGITINANITSGANWNGLFNSTQVISIDNSSMSSGPAAFISVGAVAWQAFLPTYFTNVNRSLFVKNAGTANLTVVRSGTDQLYTTSAVTSIVVAPGQTVMFVAINAYWHVFFIPSSGGSGDMAKATYDTDNNSIVDNSEALSGNNAAHYLNRANHTGSFPATVVQNNQANTYTAGNKQSLVGNATTAPINLSGSTNDPSALADGDIWHNETTHDLKFRQNATTRTVATTDGTQTLTNKTISGASNTLSNIPQSAVTNLTTDLATATTGNYIGTIYLTSGTSYTPTAGTTKIRIRMVGGGGGGGGVTSANTSIGAGGGGGSGGYLEKVVAVTNTAYTYAIGAAGTAGATTPAAGGNGGNTTITIAGTTYTANGGLGGAQMATGTTVLMAAAGAGAAVSTNGDINAGGDVGMHGIRLSGTVGFAGFGGSSKFGGGGSAPTTSANGNAGTGFGAGGSGGYSTTSTTARTGGAGTAGIIVIDEFK